VSVPVNLAFAFPLTDILVFGTIALFAFKGFKQGALRSLFGVLRVYLAFIITTLFYEKAALLLQTTSDMPSSVALMICFTTIFAASLAIIWALGSVVKKFSKGPETSSILSKIGGTVLGLVEGILIVSIVIMDIGFYFPPETQSSLEGAVFYNTVKHIAPAIKEFTVGHISRLEGFSDAL